MQKEVIGTTTPNANELQIGSGSTVIVSAAGSLGVGVTSPVYKLDVYGDINATGFVTAGTYLYSSDKHKKDTFQNYLPLVYPLRGLK
mgnify:CR=1 FL=1